MKKWDAIVRDLSSDEESDAGDSMNMRSVQKNAASVAALLQAVLPHTASPHAKATTNPVVTPPRGMNGVDLIRDGLASAAASATPPRPKGEAAGARAAGEARGEDRGEDPASRPAPGVTRTASTASTPPPSNGEGVAERAS
jgi:hypothetical protein